MKHFFRFSAAVLAAVFLFALTGCGSTETNSFTWFVDEIPANLDPQIASSAEDVIACENLYSGLVRRDPNSELVPELCERWDLSADGRTYTFYLRSGLTYTATRGKATDYAITAEDFVFAFQRVFRAQTASPYSVEFAGIENGPAVLAGELDESALGVRAVDSLTLEIRLTEPDDNFLAKLTLPGAMPCDEEFFSSTRGTYGLKSSSVLSSSSFYIYNWASTGLFLRRDAQAPMVNNLRLVQNTTTLGQTAAELIGNERCSAAPDETAEATSLRSISYSDTTWALLFNAKSNSVFRSEPLRQALAGIALDNFEIPASGLYAAAQGLVPSALTVDGHGYRQTTGNALPVIEDAQSLYLSARQGMATSSFQGVTLLLPKGSGLSEVAAQINGAWQKQCSLFFSIEEVDPEQFEKRINEGNYTIALAPIQAEGGSVYQMLRQFTAEGGALTAYTNMEYDAMLAQSAQQTGLARCQQMGECERLLLNSCTVVPLFTQQKRLLLADGVEGLVFDPFTPVLDVTYATKE